MRNLKKFLALVLAMMMMLSVAVISTGAAGDDADYTEAAQRLAALQIMKGNENGDLMLENGVTRYQAALFFVQALTGETDVATWNADKKSAHFADVPEYGTAIDYAYGINLIKGRGNGVYGYNDAIMYQDMLVMAVRALGYETADMSYPYGYILAAQKLGLTENVDLVNYKAALNRGETAQIIWDMLDTEVAVIDPLTDKVLYPGETGLTDALLGQNGQPVTERVTLMEDSELAGDKITATIVEFNEADEDDEEDVDTVVIASADLDAAVEIAAADLGITADTAKVNYMGLPVEIYIDVDAADFDQDAYDDEDAAIVFATAPSYTSVLNLGDGNIKFVANESYPEKSYFSFGGTKFAVGKYIFSVAAFDNGAWTWNSDELVTIDDLAAVFAYDADEELPYVAGLNTFGQISYRETDEVVEVEVDEDTVEEYTLVEVLYTPLSFGQYNVREINDVKYPVIATYEDNAVENLDEVSSNFVEYLVGYNKQVNVNTTKITNKQGENALSVTMAGEAVEAGEFMFYAYNETDNVLTVAKTFGDFETGRLTAKSTAKETVKISGTNYEFGFDGFNPEFAHTWDAYAGDIQGYIETLEAGMDNVKYLVVNGKIVYMEACDEVTNDSYFDFAIISTDAELMADLLDLTDTKYANALVGAVTDVTDGIYVDDNGYMAVAMLNLETGKWELASIKAVDYEWNAEDEEFDNSADPATLATYVDMFTTPSEYNKYDNYVAALDVVAETVVAVVDEDNGVYTIASRNYGEDGDFFVYGETDEGILFSDNNTKTNAITADADIDAERVVLNDESVIVVVSGGVVGVRVGAQGADDSVTTANGQFLAASSKLIVLVADDVNVDVAEWDGGSASSGLDEVYYITTVDTGAELENNEEEEDSFIITLTNLYNLNTNEIVESVQVVVESASDDLADIEGANSILVQEGDEISDVTTTVTLAKVVLEIANANDKKLDYIAVTDFATFDFASVDTIFVPGITGEEDMMATGEAVDVEVTVVTLNQVVDADKYDFDNVVLNKEWSDSDVDNKFEATDVEVTVGDAEVSYWSFELNLDEEIAEINEPTAGVFDNYALNAGANVLVPEVDNDDYADAIEVAVDYTVVAAYEDGVVYLTVYRVLSEVE